MKIKRAFAVYVVQMKQKQRSLTIFLSLFLLSLLLTQSCRRDNFITDADAKLGFSTDTLHFDTVFTTIGSATRSFKIYNRHKDAISISSIQLAGGEVSLFRMNVDGIPGVNFHDIEIPGNDSLYVFVEVTVDPNNDALPYIVEDSIFFTTNGNLQKVNLDSWGQNAHFYDSYALSDYDTVWTNDLPHVIYNYLVVDTLRKLTIQEGCRVYVHGNAGIYVLGTLQVMGTADSNVTIQGDRLESFFKEVPGQWNGIYFIRTSKNNIIQHAVIKNAIEAINAGYLTTDSTNYNDPLSRPVIEMDHTQVYDNQNIGIFSLNAEISATNCLVYSAGQNTVALTGGGKYNFKHCTIANYSSQYLTPQSAALAVTNIFVFPDYSFVTTPLEEANFTNCISYGSLAENKDLILGNFEGTEFNYNFQNCFIKTDTSLADFDDCFINTDPQFTNINERNYSPDSSSPIIDAGVFLPDVIDDIKGTVRPQGPGYDIGCYEVR